MRAIVRDFLVEVEAALDLPEPILEIGSRPASGQEVLANLRPIFPQKEFIGCDYQAGLGVDLLEDIHQLSFRDGAVGTVLALDTLEHVADPLRALQEVNRILRPGGVAVISSHMFMPIHAHPWDYWRFTPEGFELLLAPFTTRLVMANGWSLMPDTVLGIGIKGPHRDLMPSLFPSTNRRIQTWGKFHPIDLGPIRLTTRQIWRMTFDATGAALRRRASRLVKRAPSP